MKKIKLFLYRNFVLPFREMREQFRLFKANTGAYISYGKMLRKEYEEKRRLKNEHKRN